MSRSGSSSDSHRSCGGGPGSRRQWPRLDDDLGQDNSGGQNRSCGGIGLDQDRSGGENRSCGGSRAESLAPSNGSVVTSAPGDSEVSTDQEYYDSSDGKNVFKGERQGTLLSPKLREHQGSLAIEAHYLTIAAMWAMSAFSSEIGV